MLPVYCAILLLCNAACKKHASPVSIIPPEEDVNQLGVSQMDQAVNGFMLTYNIPGLSLAITKDEKLVYVKAYGAADKENNESLKTDDLFRIASISKCITSITCMKLIEEGKLGLDDQVFGQAGLLGTRYGQAPYTERLRKVTVRNLLQHTAGGWGNDGNDPMFLYPELSTDNLISRTLINVPLKNVPGAVYEYSNFGYCILGRIIEKVTGQAYDSYVKDHILTPCGISDMVIGGNTLADRKEKEVRYYGSLEGGADPYAYNITRMDSHGGWLASATDLLKLMVHADGFEEKPDILKGASIQTMITPPALAAPSGYACGWSVNNAGNWWHTGALPGTGTEMVRTHSGFNWAILTNTRMGDDFFADLDALVWKAVDDPTTVWQDRDQF